MTPIEIDNLLDLVTEDSRKKNPNDPAYKKYLASEERKAKALKESKNAETVAIKFLTENPDVNVGFLIEHLQKKILSTTQCCVKLGISPSAFARLRKKYNLSPVYSLRNKKEILMKSNRTFYGPVRLNEKAIKNFYNPKQLEIVPESEIKLIQVRAARSLKFPNGDKIGWKWTVRGFHHNGKLKARTDNLTRFKIRVAYVDNQDKYMIHYDGYRDKLHSRKDVDNLNFKLAKLKAFL
jgi:hypothetical protein